MPFRIVGRVKKIAAIKAVSGKNIDILDVISRSIVVKKACMQGLSAESKYTLFFIHFIG